MAATIAEVRARLTLKWNSAQGVDLILLDGAQIGRAVRYGKSVRNSSRAKTVYSGRGTYKGANLDDTESANLRSVLDKVARLVARADREAEKAGSKEKN